MRAGGALQAISAALLRSQAGTSRGGVGVKKREDRENGPGIQRENQFQRVKQARPAGSGGGQDSRPPLLYRPQPPPLDSPREDGEEPEKFYGRSSGFAASLLFTPPQWRPARCGQPCGPPCGPAPQNWERGFGGAGRPGGREVCCLGSLLCPQFPGGSPPVPSP